MPAFHPLMKGSGTHLTSSPAITTTTPALAVGEDIQSRFWGWDEQCGRGPTMWQRVKGTCRSLLSTAPQVTPLVLDKLTTNYTTLNPVTPPLQLVSRSDVYPLGLPRIPINPPTALREPEDARDNTTAFPYRDILLYRMQDACQEPSVAVHRSDAQNIIVSRELTLCKQLERRHNASARLDGDRQQRQEEERNVLSSFHRWVQQEGGIAALPDAFDDQDEDEDEEVHEEEGADEEEEEVAEVEGEGEAEEAPVEAEEGPDTPINTWPINHWAQHNTHSAPKDNLEDSASAEEHGTTYTTPERSKSEENLVHHTIPHTRSATAPGVIQSVPRQPHRRAASPRPILPVLSVSSDPAPGATFSVVQNSPAEQVAGPLGLSYEDAGEDMDEYEEDDEDAEEEEEHQAEDTGVNSDEADAEARDAEAEEEGEDNDDVHNDEEDEEDEDDDSSDDADYEHDYEEIERVSFACKSKNLYPKLGYGGDGRCAYCDYEGCRRDVYFGRGRGVAH